MHSLWGIRDLQREDILRLIEPLHQGAQLLRTENGAPTLAFLLMEPSTRTWSSFHLAGRAIGAKFLYVSPGRSSIAKGESVEDTVANLKWMGVKGIIIRTPEAGLPEKLSDLHLPVINAGDGTNEHPTQALLDAATLYQHFREVAGLRVLIAGDVVHSRVARSNFYCLPKLGVEVLAAGPKLLQKNVPTGVRVIPFSEGIKYADAVMMLRWQSERHIMGNYFDESEICQHTINEETLNMMPAHAMVMHPGPIGYGREIATKEIARGPRSLVARQVAMGVEVRKRILWEMLSGD